MTTLAVLEPPLRRLFARIDFAPQPKSEQLKELLSLWVTERDGAIAPKLAAFDPRSWSTRGLQAFSFHHDAPAQKYLLDHGAESLKPVLGPIEIGGDLATSSLPRAAARLRRLFDAVREAGEPALAEFIDTNLDMFVEIVVAPLSSDGRHVDGLIGALTTRPSIARKPHFRPRTDKHPPLLFALSGSEALGERIATHLGIRPSPHEFRLFEDGEHKGRPLVSVRDRDVYILSSLWSDAGSSVNDRFCRLLFFIGCLRDGAAARITAVIPYLGFARKDRKTKPRDPVTTRYVAQLLEAVGLDRVVALDIHNVAAFQNAFRCSTEHLSAAGLFARTLVGMIGDGAVTVVSPDLGGGKRSEEVRERLELVLRRPVESGFMEKYRSQGVVTGELFAGEVRDRTVIIVDDLISSGTTMARCARACHERGAKQIFLAATHGLFTAQASKVVGEPFISGVLVTDTVPQKMGSNSVPKLTVLSAGELLGEAILRVHSGGSITEMIDDYTFGAARRSLARP